MANVLTDYIDQKYYRKVPFGSSSHYMQPWRSWFEVKPAGYIQGVAGLNILCADGREYGPLMQHMQKYGWKWGRFEVDFSAMDFTNPGNVATSFQPTLNKVLSACATYNIRPLFLLNAPSGKPCPCHQGQVKLAAQASLGATSISIDLTTFAGNFTLSDLVVNYSGADGSFGTGTISTPTSSLDVAAFYIFTSSDGNGNLGLSQPIGATLASGTTINISHLKYRPLYPSQGATPPGPLPYNSNYYPQFSAYNSIYQESMTGWRNYVQGLANYVNAFYGTPIGGDPGFDLEVWNEFINNSYWLNANNYYSPHIATLPTNYQYYTYYWDMQDAAVTPGLLNPSNSLYGVQVGSGWSNITPFFGTSNQPGGIAAIDKHLYPAFNSYFVGMPFNIWPQNTTTVPVIDANGNRITPIPPPISGNNDPSFWIPNYIVAHPEDYMCAINKTGAYENLNPNLPNESLTRNGPLLGRYTYNTYVSTGTSLDGTLNPNFEQFWMTEFGIQPSDLQGSPVSVGTLSNADAEYIKAKTTLRAYCFYANKGEKARVYMFTAQNNRSLASYKDWGVVSKSFWQYLLANNYQYPTPDTSYTSTTMSSWGNLVQATLPSASVGVLRTITINSISDTHNNMQFAGNPATVGQNPNPEPPLYDRDCLAILPFQRDPNTLAFIIYVMSRNIVHDYSGGLSTDPSRFTLPDEQFTIDITGINSMYAQVTGYDPMGNTSVAASLSTVSSNEVLLTVTASDVPRVFTITDAMHGGSGGAGFIPQAITAGHGGNSKLASIADYISDIKNGNGFINIYKMYGDLEFSSFSSVYTLTLDGVNGDDVQFDWAGQDTLSIAGDSNASTIQSTIAGLSTVGTNGVLVTGTNPTFTITILPSAIVPFSSLSVTGAAVVSLIPTNIMVIHNSSSAIIHGFNEIDRYYINRAGVNNRNDYVQTLFGVMYNMTGRINYSNTAISGVNQMYLCLLKNNDVSHIYAKSKVIDIPTSGSSISFNWQNIDTRDAFSKGMLFTQTGDFVSLQLYVDLNDGNGLTVNSNIISVKSTVLVEEYGVMG